MNLNVALPVGEISLTPEEVICSFCGTQMKFDVELDGCKWWVCPRCRMEAGFCEGAAAEQLCRECEGPLKADDTFAEDGYKWWCEGCEGFVKEEEVQ